MQGALVITTTISITCIAHDCNSSLCLYYLHKRPEPVDASLVHEVVHARVGPHIAVAVIALRRQDRPAQLQHVLLAAMQTQQSMDTLRGGYDGDE